jgi:integrase
MNRRKNPSGVRVEAHQIGSLMLQTAQSPSLGHSDDLPNRRRPTMRAAVGGRDYRNWRWHIFTPAATSAGVPGIRPYDLRHSFASLLLAQGRSVIDVADQLGHAPTLTLDTYGHVMRELEGRNPGPDDSIAAARQLRTAESG